MAFNPIDRIERTVEIDTRSQAIHPFIGKYALRNHPVESGDSSYMTNPIRIQSAIKNGPISTYWDTDIHLLSWRWNDKNWHDVTPQNSPKHFLKNQCYQLNDEEAKAACLQNVKSVFKSFFTMSVQPLPNRNPLSDLLNQCEQIPNDKERNTCQESTETLQKLLGKMAVVEK